MKKSMTLYRLMFFVLLTVIVRPVCNGQAALIVLILGDKVATENFHLSVDAGLNLSSLPGMEDGKTAGGVNFGLGTHIKLGEKWHLKPEFKPLSRKGVRKVGSITNVPPELTIETNKLKLYYIDIPVFLQYNVSPRFFISAGPQVSFLTDAYQYSTGYLEDETSSTIKISTKSFFNNINFSFPVEAGYSLNLSNKRSTTKMEINVFVRYEYAFLEVFKDPEAGSSRISLFQLGASLPFIKSPEELAKGRK